MTFVEFFFSLTFALYNIIVILLKIVFTYKKKFTPSICQLFLALIYVLDFIYIYMFLIQIFDIVRVSLLGGGTFRESELFAFFS